MGASLVQLRTPSLEGGNLVSLAKACVAQCRRVGARLLLNADPMLVEAVGADGVHLDSRRLLALDARPLGDDLLVAASCHDERELAHAGRIGVDFAVLSPVLPTLSHPDAITLGWDGFERLVERAAIPVYALGGLGGEAIAEARRHGGQGVAGIRAFW